VHIGHLVVYTLQEYNVILIIEAVPYIILTGEVEIITCRY
jgi:hypothetical protein